MGIHQGLGPRILTLYISAHTHTVVSIANVTVPNRMGDEEEGEIERKREKGEDEEGEWIESNYFLFTPPHPLRLSLSLFGFCSTTSPTSRKKDGVTNTHTIAIAKNLF